MKIIFDFIPYFLTDDNIYNTGLDLKYRLEDLKR